MPTRRALLLPLLLLPLLAAYPAGLLAAEAEPLDLDALMRGLAAVPARQAEFREERQFAVLDRPLLSTGRLTYRRPGYLEKATEWPAPERLVVDGDRLILTAGNEPPRVVDLGGQPELRILVDAIRGPLSGDLIALRRAFTIGTSGTAQRWTLDLVPRDDRAARLLRRAQVSGVGDAVVAVRLEQANGDAQAMTIGPSH